MRRDRGTSDGVRTSGEKVTGGEGLTGETGFQKKERVNRGTRSRQKGLESWFDGGRVGNRVTDLMRGRSEKDQVRINRDDSVEPEVQEEDTRRSCWFRRRS